MTITGNPAEVLPGLTPRPSLNDHSGDRVKSMSEGVAGSNPPALIERRRKSSSSPGLCARVAGSNPPALIERLSTAPPVAREDRCCRV